MNRPTYLAMFLTLVLGAPGTSAQQHAHRHGHLTLDVAVDEKAMTLQIDSPLENFLGFEHAPRIDAERRRLDKVVERLKAAEQLFRPDPAALCKLATVELQSEVLDTSSVATKHARLNGDAKEKFVPNKEVDHADLAITVVFSCASARSARHIDAELMNEFKAIRSIDAQVASPQGQAKRTLNPRTTRLTWGR